MICTYQNNTTYLLPMISINLLALQFIQQLDDIAFALCKLDVLGKRLQRASMTPYYTVEFQVWYQLDMNYTSFSYRMD